MCIPSPGSVEQADAREPGWIDAVTVLRGAEVRRVLDIHHERRSR
jgi:hypothetical protein